MLKTLSTLAIVVATALPVGATPVRHPHYSNGGQCAGVQGSGCRYSLDIVNPDEVMIQVPGLEYLGPSRVSTVVHCSTIEELDWQNLITDSDFDQMEACLIEHT